MDVLGGSIALLMDWRSNSDGDECETPNGLKCDRHLGCILEREVVTVNGLKCDRHLGCILER